MAVSQNRIKYGTGRLICLLLFLLAGCGALVYFFLDRSAATDAGRLVAAASPAGRSLDPDAAPPANSTHVGKAGDGTILCLGRGKKKDNDGRRAANNSVTVPQFFADGACGHQFEDVVFFHVGKGGGGTVKMELNRHRIGAQVSHPSPRSEHVQSLRRGPASTLLVNVRDPVDRFVSAFNWRSLLLCGPDDHRERNRTTGCAVRNPTKCCQRGRVAQERMLHGQYHSNVNLMAEALCEGPPSREQAAADFRKVGPHSRPLVEWLDFLVEPELAGNVSEDGIKSLITLPLEKRVGAKNGFKDHIRSLLVHLFQSRYPEETAERIIQHQSAKVDRRKKEASEHSSVKFYTNSNNPSSAAMSGPPPELSPLGECCPARHLEKDYRLIQTMLGEDSTEEATHPATELKPASVPAITPLDGVHPAVRTACSWGSAKTREACRSDLRSMVLRRAKFLDASRGPCAGVVADPAGDGI